MQITSRDNSHQSEIQRLRNNQEALEKRLAAIEPQVEQPRPDAKAERAAQKVRDEAIAALQEKLRAWKTQSAAIDKLVSNLCEMVKAERELRAGIVTTHHDLIEKENRRALQNDQAVISGLQAMLGDTLRPRTDQVRQSFADLSTRYATMILQQVESADLDTLLN